MKLRYIEPAASHQVLLREQHRIELFIGKLEDELFTLAMLAGNDQALPDKHKLQGPYHNKAQALAASGAISQALIEKGYTSVKEITIWRIAAQALIRDNQTERKAHHVNSEFIPLGIMPDSPSREDE
jgi:hypothetical protein